MPKLTKAGEKADTEAAAPARPIVEVPERDGPVAAGTRRVASHREARGLHHPPRTPAAGACPLVGRCWGGHRDEPGLQRQLAKAREDLEPPDIVLAAHNHLYARSHPLDGEGRVTTEGKGAERYFITGGGGAPLYTVDRPDARFAKAESMYSGCSEKGSNVDRPPSSEFRYDDALPPGCVAAR